MSLKHTLYFAWNSLYALIRPTVDLVNTERVDFKFPSVLARMDPNG